MAIIKGVTASKVGKVTPFTEDVDKMAAGVLARENRANETRNQISKTQAELIAATRDHDEDWGLAKELQDEYRNEVAGLVDQADKDFSNVSRDQLQTLATKYAGDDRFRALSSWKKNSDEFVAAKQTLEAKGKIPLIFGIDPTKESLRDDDGGFRHATNKWAVEEELDAPAAAQKLFDNRIGHTMKETLNWDKSKGDWMTYWTKWWSQNKDNHTQVNEIINGHLNDFIDKTPEGNQYYRKLMRDYRADGIDEESADKQAREVIQDLITRTGNSLKKDEFKQQSSLQTVNDNVPMPPKARSGGRSGGGGGSGKEPPSARRDKITYSVDGLNINNSANALDAEQEIGAMDYDEKSLKSVKTVNELNNYHAVAEKMTNVSNPYSGGENEGTYIQDEGTLMALDLSLTGRRPAENRAVLALNNIKDDGTLNSTTESNYRKLSGTPSVGEIKALGDQFLFTREEFMSASVAERNPFESANEKRVSKFDQGNTHAISTMNVKYNDSPGNFSSVIDVNPVLERMKSNYDTKIDSFKTLMDKAQADGDTQAFEENKRLHNLYSAKSERMGEKIDETNQFMIDHKDEIGDMSSHQVRLMHGKKELYEVNKFIFRSEGLDYDTYLEAQEPKNKNNPKYKDYADVRSLYNTARQKGYEKGLAQVGMGNMIDGVFQESESFKDGANNKRIDQVTNIYTQLLDRIRKGKVLESDLREIPGWENRDLSDLNSVQIFKGLFDEALFKKGLAKEPQLTNYSLGSVSGLADKDILGYVNKLGERYVYTQGFMEYDPTGKKINLNSPEPDPGKAFNQAYNKGMSDQFKGKNQAWLKTFQRIEEMDDVFAIEGKIMISGKDTTGNDHIKNAMTDMLWNSINDPGQSGEMRNLIYGEGDDGKVIKEEFNRQELIDSLEAEYVASETKEDRISWKKKRLTQMITGVMFDDTNESSENTLVFSTPDGNQRIEMDITLSRADLLNIYGVSGYELSANEELRTGLQQNKGHYFDLSGFGGRPGMRVFRALYDDPSHGISKGSFYVLSKTGDMKDPSVGSTDYSLSGNYKPVVFNSKFDLFKAHRDNYNTGSADKLIEKLSLLKRGYDPNLVFDADGPEAPFRNMTREQALNELQSMIKQEIEGTGNFNEASTIHDFTTTGVVQESKDDDGNDRTFINPNTFASMSNETKKLAAFASNPELKNQTWFKSDDDQDYLADPNTLVDLDSDDLSNINYGSAKMSFNKPTANFLKGIDDVVNSMKNNDWGSIISTIPGTNPADLQLIDPNELITITSGLRSVQDNLRAYNASGKGNISNVTVSPHMAGKSIDIRTESMGNKPGRNWEGGANLWKFLKTPSGSALLKHYGMRAFYHNVKGGVLHIDISEATGTHPAGKVFQNINGKRKTYYSGK